MLLFYILPYPGSNTYSYPGSNTPSYHGSVPVAAFRTATMIAAAVAVVVAVAVVLLVAVRDPVVGTSPTRALLVVEPSCSTCFFIFPFIRAV